MGAIQLLKREVSELIAAGEVIERPASIVKELLENAIDAGASTVTVEIARGGKNMIRVIDNGFGMFSDDVSRAFLRHATSKVSTADDLNHIITLGFRGEALASICMVAKVDVVTKRTDEPLGTHYVINGGEECLKEQIGCPKGTTFTVKDIFYNVPARYKFLKKDITETNAIVSVIGKIALSHPEVSIRFIKDKRRMLQTPGNGDLYATIRAIYGKDFVETLIPVKYKNKRVSVKGYISHPFNSRASRTMQHFFVNGRYIKSTICTNGLEEGYKGSLMKGKFPACVLLIHLPYDTIDVNVHPTKIEVRFADEQLVLQSVYFAVKQAITEEGKKNLQNQPLKPHVEKLLFHEVNQRQIDQMRMGNASTTFPDSSQKKLHESVLSYATYREAQDVSDFTYLTKDSFQNRQNNNVFSEDASQNIILESPQPTTQFQENAKNDLEQVQPMDIRVLGELFGTFILAQTKDTFVLMDKHAAHERIIYEELKKQTGKSARQILLKPVQMSITYEEYDLVFSNLDKISSLGFLVESFGNNTIIIREIPIALSNCDCQEVFGEIINNLRRNKRDLSPGALDELLHSMACKAAIRAQDQNNLEELTHLFQQAFFDESIRYCPHGRPVMLLFKREQLEKKFGR